MPLLAKNMKLNSTWLEALEYNKHGVEIKYVHPRTFVETFHGTSLQSFPPNV
jgi:hypothetical protein